MKENRNLILVFSNSRKRYQEIKELVKKSCGFVICTHRYEEGISIASKDILQLIIIDSYLLNIKDFAYSKFLKNISEKYLCTKTIILVEEMKPNIISDYIYKGFPYVITINLAQCVIPAILKRDQKEEQDLIYHNIHLNIQHQYLILNGCKIFLTKTETRILQILIIEKTYSSHKLIMGNLRSEEERVYSNGYLSSKISTLNSKIYKVTGRRIIKVRSCIGYYLCI